MLPGPGQGAMGQPGTKAGQVGAHQPGLPTPKLLDPVSLRTCCHLSVSSPHGPSNPNKRGNASAVLFTKRTTTIRVNAISAAKEMSPSMRAGPVEASLP